MKNLPSKERYMDEIDFSVFFNILWVNKNLIFTFITVFSLTSIFYALSLDNIYTAKSIINPSSGDNPSKLSNQYGGIAAIAGIELNSSDSEVEVAIAFINSKRLVSELMKHDSFLPNLMASKKWNIKNQEITYNENIYDPKNNNWIRNVAPPLKQVPSVQEAHEVFSKLVKISQHKSTKLITLSVDHISPVIAQEWAVWIIEEANSLVSNMRVKESQDSIDYLNEQIKVTPYAELRTMFYELIQQKTQKMMLAKVNPEYALTTIDPPLIPEIKSKPNRSMICIFGFFLGAILSIFFIFIRDYLFIKKDEIT